jgi:hypothetical protein
MIKNFLSSKNIFYFTLILFVINVGIFLASQLLGFVVFGWGLIIITPIALLLGLFDRFYLKNKNAYFFVNIIFLGVLWSVLYLLSQAYFDSVIDMI